MANYIEYVVCVPSVDEKDFGTVVNTNVDAKTFESFMLKLKHKKLKYYERRIKTYAKNCLFYEVVLDQKDDVNDIKCYEKAACDYEFESPSLIRLQFNKHKKPVHTFSSSYDINAVTCSRRLTFRVSNRIFINFEVSRDVGSSEDTRKIFININLDSNVDQDYLYAKLDEFLHIFRG